MTISYLVVIIVGLVAWQLIHTGTGNDVLLGPLQTFSFTFQLLHTSGFWTDCFATLRAFGIGLAVTVVGGLSVGTVLGFHRFSGAVAEPLLVGAYSIPKVTLYPVILLLVGIGTAAQVTFGVLHGIFPIVIFTMNGIRQIRPIYRKAARAMRLSCWDTARLILLPGALPQIVTGMRVGFSLTLLGTLIGEMFGSQHGLGYLLMSAIGLHQIPMMMAVTLLVVVPALAASFCLLAIEGRLYARKMR